MSKKKFYVALALDGTRRIFTSWEECKAYRDSLPGIRVQSVDSLEKAEKMVAGGIHLEPGTYAFTDGNALGGVGIVVVASSGDEVRVHHEVATNVFAVFVEGAIRGLESRDAVSAALEAHHNILAELAGLYGALNLVPAGSSITVVHDYAGIGEWMTEGGWKTRGPITASVVAECQALIARRALAVSYQHQRGHQSIWAGRDDYARWNGRADELASEGVNHHHS